MNALTLFTLCLFAIFISPATLLLAAKLLRMPEVTLTRCLIASVTLILIMAAYHYVSQLSGVSQLIWLDLGVAMVLMLLILGWQMQTGYVTSLALSCIWGILLVAAYLGYATVVGIAWPSWAQIAALNVDASLNANDADFNRASQENASVLTQD